MTDDQYERIMAAGVELFEHIKPLLEKHGLSDECAPSMLSVCFGAILKFSGASVGDVITGAELMQRYWDSDPESSNAFTAVFRPFYREN